MTCCGMAGIAALRFAKHAALAEQNERAELEPNKIELIPS